MGAMGQSPEFAPLPLVTQAPCWLQVAKSFSLPMATAELGIVCCGILRPVSRTGIHGASAGVSDRNSTLGHCIHTGYHAPVCHMSLSPVLPLIRPVPRLPWGLVGPADERAKGEPADEDHCLSFTLQMSK